MSILLYVLYLRTTLALLMEYNKRIKSPNLPWDTIITLSGRVISSPKMPEETLKTPIQIFKSERWGQTPQSLIKIQPLQLPCTKQTIRPLIDGSSPIPETLSRRSSLEASNRHHSIAPFVCWLKIQLASATPRGTSMFTSHKARLFPHRTKMDSNSKIVGGHTTKQYLNSISWCIRVLTRTVHRKYIYLTQRSTP